MITYGVAIPNQANQAVGIVGAIPTCYLWEYWCPNLDSTVVSFKAFTMRLPFESWQPEAESFTTCGSKRNGCAAVWDGFQTLGCSTEL
jgi:hypothetical protein